MGMESPTAWQLMPQLCEALGINYPPRNGQQIDEKRQHMADPLKESK
jgi:CO dehydrogenase/acetyl-CoA synthase gamma subunit (corrinoid Fe-S protein)